MEERRIIPQDEILAAANQVAKRLSGTGGFDQDVQAREVLAFAKFALELQHDQIVPINPISLLDAPEVKKPELAQERIRQLLSPLAIAQPRGYRRFFDRGVQELRDFLGVGSRAKLAMAVDGLSDVERQLFFSVAPVSLLQDLGYLDLDTCQPPRSAQYIRNAAFDRNIPRRDDTLGLLIVSAAERADQGTMDLTEIVDILCQSKESSQIFDRLIESAQWGEFRDELIQFFDSHHLTVNLASQVRKQMDSEDVDIDISPKYRLSHDR